jgi:hypothetical protein
MATPSGAAAAAARQAASGYALRALPRSEGPHTTSWDINPPPDNLGARVIERYGRQCRLRGQHFAKATDSLSGARGSSMACLCRPEPAGHTISMRSRRPRRCVQPRHDHAKECRSSYTSRWTRLHADSFGAGLHTWREHAFASLSSLVMRPPYHCAAVRLEASASGPVAPAEVLLAASARRSPL